MDGSLVCCSSVHFYLGSSYFEMNRLAVLFRMKEENLLHNLFLKGSF